MKNWKIIKFFKNIFPKKEVKSKRILHISDTHGYHSLLKIEDNIDIIIHSGDFSNKKDFYLNEPEALDFLRWYSVQKPKYKVLVAGNHDAYPATHKKDFIKLCEHYNIIYLEDDWTLVDGISIWGSPVTPNFGNWWFMKDRSKMDKLYSSIPEWIDVVVSHGPPKGILDLSYSRDGKLEYCGCRSLKNHMLNRVKPKLCLFGHIHNTEDIINAGTVKLSDYDTIFSNGSVVTDGKFGKLSSNGNILEI